MGKGLRQWIKDFDFMYFWMWDAWMVPFIILIIGFAAVIVLMFIKICQIA